MNEYPTLDHILTAYFTLLLHEQHQYGDRKNCELPEYQEHLPQIHGLFLSSTHCIIGDSGGQLEIIAKENKVTHGLKTNTASCFYALILQALRIRDHKASLIMLGLGHEAQHSVDGLKLPSQVMLLQLSLDFEINHWRWTDHIHQGKVHAQRHPVIRSRTRAPRHRLRGRRIRLRPGARTLRRCTQITPSSTVALSLPSAPRCTRQTQPFGPLHLHTATLDTSIFTTVTAHRI